MKNYQIWIFKVFIFSLFIFPMPGTCDPTGVNSDRTNPTLKEAGTQFQRLSKIKGHFTGEDWHNDVDRWMGKKHRLMIFLQERLLARGATKKEVLEIMGKPNKNMKQLDFESSGFSEKILQEIRSRSWDEILIYYWRYDHDFLYFIFKKDQMVESAWWFAHEK
ncbi:MAG: hypothetical protein GY710_25300 [Desulfobacteraceae bacterium]|nr:hypothetical protein [Desulfobacteraceae bacterium]